MAAAAAPGNGDDDGGVPRRVSRAELVKRWEHVFDNVGDEDAMEVFMTLLLRDARAENAQKSPKEQVEEEERRARVFEPWHPPMQPLPRVDRSVVLGLRAPPHLTMLPSPKQEATTTPAEELGHANNTRRRGV